MITLSDIRANIGYKLSGRLTTAVLNDVINQSVIDVLADNDILTNRRRVPLSLSGANSIYHEGIFGRPTPSDVADEESLFVFHCPDDMLGDSLIDIRKRYEKISKYELTTPEEFLLKKNQTNSLVAIDESSFIRRLLINNIPEITTTMLNSCDTYNGNGTWTADGSEVVTVATTTDEYVEGSGAISLTTVSGSMVGGTVTNSTMTAVDLTNYDTGSIYVWVYVPVSAGLTSFSLKWGSSSGNYFSRTVTRNHDNCVFTTGWNLLRFPISDGVQTGTVVKTAINYVQLTIVKSTTNTGTSSWLIDRVIACADSGYDVVYLSGLGWRNGSGIYIEKATTDTDTLNFNSKESNLVVLKASEYGSSIVGDDNAEAKFAQQYSLAKRMVEVSRPSDKKVHSSKYYETDYDIDYTHY